MWGFIPARKQVIHIVDDNSNWATEMDKINMDFLGHSCKRVTEKNELIDDQAS